MENVDRYDCCAAYQQAWSLWQEKKVAEAEDVVLTFWQRSSVQSLRGMLLMAYILRDERRYVSEVTMLYELLSRFDGAAERNLLADAWSVLGSALRMLGENELSVQAFLKSMDLEPRLEQRLVECSNALFAANAIPGISAERMQGLYARYRELLGGLQIRPYPIAAWHHATIRVGYLSADLYGHAVAQFIRPLLCGYDPDRFSVYVYRLNAKTDDITKRLQAGQSIWRDACGISWQELAAKIRADEIDILVDLSGHSAGNALPVFAWRPASVQLSGIGYFNSTGIVETRGFLSDIYCAPEPYSPYFIEPLLRLPYSHFCYQPFTYFPEVGTVPCLRNGYITFGCFNNFAKVNDDRLLLWKEILGRLPDAHLLLKHSLLGTDEGRIYTLNRFRRLGLPLERIELRGLSADYLTQYHDMDIALDTSPYPGGLTTCEALYMGVPVVTLKGNRHGARFGYSFLANLDLTELVADSNEEYVSIAVRLGKDKELLQLLRQKLRGMMQKSSLMNGKQYMQALEVLYKNLLEQALVEE